MIKKIIKSLFPNTIRKIEIDFFDNILTAWFLKKNKDTTLIYEDNEGMTYEVKIIFRR